MDKTQKLLIHLNGASLRLGITFLVNGLFTKGKHFIFHPATDSSKVLKNMENRIDSLSPSSAVDSSFV